MNANDYYLEKIKTILRNIQNKYEIKFATGSYIRIIFTDSNLENGYVEYYNDRNGTNYEFSFEGLNKLYHVLKNDITDILQN